MSATDLTGRTNGAGEHFHVAGVEYVWTIGDTGRLKAERFDREEFGRQLRELAKRLGVSADRLAASGVLEQLRPRGIRSGPGSRVRSVRSPGP